MGLRESSVSWEMVFPTAGAVRDRVKEIAAPISWHLFSVRLVIRFFFSSRRFEFVRRWWEIRWIRVALRLWREELVNRVCFLVDNYGPEEGVGDNARDILLLPESAWFDNYYAPLEIRINELKVKYEDNEGPQDPRQEQMLAQLKEEYMQYVFEMRELEEPILSFEEWYQMTYKASQMGVQAPQEEMMSEEMMMREPAAYGGIMDTDSGRRMYGFGSIFKKITRPIKKAVKGVTKTLKKISKSKLGLSLIHI